MIMGYNPRPLPTVFEKTSVPSVEERLHKLRKLRGDVAGIMEIARRKMIKRANKGTDKFTEGQKVWLEGKNLDFGYPSKKLSPKREGPFVIDKVMGPVTYRLKLPPQWKIHPVFHASLLRPYKETEAHGKNFLEPPPDIVEGHEEFEIEAIIGHKPLQKPRRYLVSWKGFDSSHNEWKTKEELEHAMDLYLDYIVKNKLTSSYSVCSLPDTPSGTTAFSDDITYSGPFNPSPFELLFLVNTSGHDDVLRNASVGQPHLHGIGTRPSDLTGAHDSSLSPDICDSDPNSPEFLWVATTYNTRIQAAVELACDQYDFCPHHIRTEPVLPRLANPSPVVPKLEPPSSPSPIKSEPSTNSPSDLLYPSDSSSQDLSPLYTQSIGVALASPSLAPESQSQPAPTSAPTDPFNPFDVDDEPLAPSTVPFLANGQFNPAFISIRDVVHTNPGVQIDTRAFTNSWASVWDDKTASETAEQAERRATVEEVHEFLCALCAEWHTTAPATV
uniref:Chromo domain-containing protein n=1 Tax=Moniliophthora roreri TaxID=221103 RepID=A0A0W0FAH4_MONRR